MFTAWFLLKMYIFFMQVGVICNNATINGDTLQGQPTEGALLAVAMKVFKKLNLLLFINLIYFVMNFHFEYRIECMVLVINT